MDYGEKQIDAQKGQYSFGDAVRRVLAGLIPNSRPTTYKERPDDVPAPTLTAGASEQRAAPEIVRLEAGEMEGVHDLDEVRKKHGKRANPRLEALRKPPNDRQAGKLDALRKKNSA